jgi:hypothetical protein
MRSFGILGFWRSGVSICLAWGLGWSVGDGLVHGKDEEAAFWERFRLWSPWRGGQDGTGLGGWEVDWCSGSAGRIGSFLGDGKGWMLSGSVFPVWSRFGDVLLTNGNVWRRFRLAFSVDRLWRPGAGLTRDDGEEQSSETRVARFSGKDGMG